MKQGLRRKARVGQRRNNFVDREMFCTPVMQWRWSALTRRNQSDYICSSGVRHPIKWGCILERKPISNGNAREMVQYVSLLTSEALSVILEEKYERKKKVGANRTLQYN